MKRRQLFSRAFIGTVLGMGLLSACTGFGSDAASDDQTLTMATSADYPPYEFIRFQDGSEDIVGFDVDIARAIAQELGYDLEVTHVDFNRLIPTLQEGRADFVMSAMTPTEERKQKVDFSSVYYTAHNTIVAPPGNNLTTAESLTGRRVGVQQGSTQQGTAREIAGATVVPFNRMDEIIQELKAGRIDAAIVEDAVARGYVAANPDLAFNVMPNQEPTDAAIAFPKDSPLRDEFEPILQRMIANGEVNALAIKWFEEQTAQ